ncbi:MAG: hypothetical protein MUO97_00350 [Dehalococcoidia bacterium]|nr:hypothetical protein [Dehalococcoidia bacterium]
MNIEVFYFALSGCIISPWLQNYKRRRVNSLGLTLMDSIGDCAIVNFLGDITVIGSFLTITVFIIGVFFSMRLQYVHGFRNMDNQACTYAWLMQQKKDESYKKVVELYLKSSKEHRKDVIFLGRRCLEMVGAIIFMLIALFLSVVDRSSNILTILTVIFTALGMVFVFLSSLSVFRRYTTDDPPLELIICNRLVTCTPFLRKILGEGWVRQSNCIREMIPEDILRNIKMSNELEEGGHGMKDCLKRLWNQIMSKGEIIGGILFILGFLLLLLYAVLVMAFSLRKDTGLLAVALGIISVGLGFIAIGMSVKLDIKVGNLPKLLLGDEYSPPLQLLEKKQVGGSSKDAAQKRLDEDTKKVGYVRGEIYEVEKGKWAIRWGGKYPL